MNQFVVLNGADLTIGQVVNAARDWAPIRLDGAALQRLAASRRAVEAAASSGKPVYGLNTGFGKLASVRIDQDQLRDLQRNLIISHASGMGAPLPVDLVRAMMVIRINGLLRETSGVRPVVPERLAEMLNAGIQPEVPEQGSVGASGDLAPLAHLAQGLMGEGAVMLADVSSREAGLRRVPAQEAMEQAGIEPLTLEAKEGLALINGTQAQTAVLALAVFDATRLWRNAHAAAALSLEALKGTPTPFDERVHAARPHPGQVGSAEILRHALEGSEIRESHRDNDPRVQDAYSLRCMPQILGPVRDAIEFAERAAAIELNASTDNPLVFGNELLSGGNFHGQVVAMALDFLCIALTTLAGVAERRLERVINPDLSPGLPAFLASNPGVESGMMMVQIGAASLVGECRTLCTPASVQSVPTDANQEDYVPMSMAAAFKCRRVLENARRVVACELLCGAQGIEYHRPLTAGPMVEAVYARVRQMVPALNGDRSLHADLERLTTLLTEEALI